MGKEQFSIAKNGAQLIKLVEEVYGCNPSGRKWPRLVNESLEARCKAQWPENAADAQTWRYRYRCAIAQRDGVGEPERAAVRVAMGRAGFRRMSDLAEHTKLTLTQLTDRMRGIVPWEPGDLTDVAHACGIANEGALRRLVRLPDRKPEQVDLPTPPRESFAAIARMTGNAPADPPPADAPPARAIPGPGWAWLEGPADGVSCAKLIYLPAVVYVRPFKASGAQLITASGHQILVFATVEEVARLIELANAQRLAEDRRLHREKVELEFSLQQAENHSLVAEMVKHQRALLAEQRVHSAAPAQG